MSFASKSNLYLRPSSTSPTPPWPMPSDSGITSTSTKLVYPCLSNSCSFTGNHIGPCSDQLVKTIESLRGQLDLLQADAASARQAEARERTKKVRAEEETSILKDLLASVVPAVQKCQQELEVDLVERLTRAGAREGVLELAQEIAENMVPRLAYDILMERLQQRLGEVGVTLNESKITSIRAPQGEWPPPESWKVRRTTFTNTTQDWLSIYNGDEIRGA